MVSIENNAKELAYLLKRKEKLETSIRKLNEEITKQQGKLNKQFDVIGLDTNFS
jgi:cell division protein FtsB